MSDNEEGISGQDSQALLERLIKEYRKGVEWPLYPNSVQVNAGVLWSLLDAFHHGTLTDLCAKMDNLEVYLLALFQINEYHFEDEENKASQETTDNSTPVSQYWRVDPQAEALAQRDGGWYCHYCHAPVSLNPQHGERHVNKDHMTPRARGGSNDQDNLVLACPQCNQRKGARYTYEEFYALTADTRTARSQETEHVTAS